MTDQPTEPEKLAQQIETEIGSGADRPLPPVEKWNPDFSGEMDMRIARNGQWFYRNNLLKREALVKLFSTILRLDEDDEFYLVTPVEKFRIQVEDAPFVAHSLEREGKGNDQVLWLTTNVGDRLRIDDEHPLWVESGAGEEPAPYVRVRRNLNALVERQTFYELANLASDGDGRREGQLGVYSAGIFYPIGNAA